MRLIFLLLFFTTTVYGDLIRKDESAFFPPQIADDVSTFKNFPIFWWNFLIVDGLPKEHRKDLCDHLRTSGQFRHVECAQDFSLWRKTLTSWAFDVKRRQGPTSAREFRRSMNRTLARASVAIPRPLLDVLRTDPLEQTDEFLAKFQDRLPLHLPRVDGFFIDESTGYVVIPLQPRGPPNASKVNAETLRILNGFFESYSGRWALFGPHGSAQENRAQVERDLRRISWVGPAVILLLVALLVFTGRGRAFLLLVPVVVGIAASTLMTIQTLGSIHGLTLAFGVGLIGLSLDYGFHWIFAKDKGPIWRTNRAGLITTLAVFAVIGFSSIPLLRELVLFSSFGLVFSFMGIFALSLKKEITLEPIRIGAYHGKAGVPVLGGAILGLLLALVFVDARFDLRSFDFQSHETRDLRTWAQETLVKRSPLFQIDSTQDRELSFDRKDWAESSGLSIETYANYLARLEEQQEFLDAWRDVCGKNRHLHRASKTQREFFAPFFTAMTCERLAAPLEDAPEYVSHLNAHNRWLTLWFPADEGQAAMVAEKYPEVRSLASLVSEEFPNHLISEIRWMLPLSVLLIFLILWRHFGSWSSSLVALTPFVTGLGLFAWFALVGLVDFTFISCVSLIMIAGLSVDYGIFAVEGAKNGEHSAGVRSALLAAGLTTVIGFAPLLFCQHGVLLQLGSALIVGMLGSLLGTFFVVPSLLGLRR